MKSTNVARAWGFIIDYVIWYAILVILIGFHFFVVKQYKPISGNLHAYREMFDSIMHDRNFVFLYLGIIVIYEVGVPFITRGRSVSKLIMKTSIAPANNKVIIIRGLIKVFIVNPCGVVSFAIGSLIVGIPINTVSNILSGIFIVDILLVFMHRPAVHDFLTKSCVQLKK